MYFIKIIFSLFISSLFLFFLPFPLLLPMILFFPASGSIDPFSFDMNISSIFRNKYSRVPYFNEIRKILFSTDFIQ